jgi:hypothetical protein
MALQEASLREVSKAEAGSQGVESAEEFRVVAPALSQCLAAVWQLKAPAEPGSPGALRMQA